jgi:spore germination protein KC
MALRGKRLIAAAMLIPVLAASLSGCWDSHELDAMFIITGVALDVSESPDLMDITLQIGVTKSSSSGSGESNSEQDSVILLKATSDTVMGGMTMLNRDSSHKLLLHHNQVLLLGSSLAEQGVESRLDLFLRDQQARMEVPVMVVEGRAEEVLSAKLDQDRISGIFLSRMLEDLSKISPAYRVRMIDFASRLLDDTTSPVAPIATVLQEDGKQEIKISGLAVFKGDRMIGRLNNDEATGYVWSMGDVKKYVVTASTGDNKAVLNIARMACKRDVTLRPDGGVRVELSVDATLGISELSGFSDMTTDELMPYLVRMAQQEIQRKITSSFDAARRLDADIYGFGTSVYQKYPKEWKAMKDRWDEIFPGVELSVLVKARLPATGQIVQPLEMEEKTP